MEAIVDGCFEAEPCHGQHNGECDILESRTGLARPSGAKFRAFGIHIKGQAVWNFNLLRV